MSGNQLVINGKHDSDNKNTRSSIHSRKRVSVLSDQANSKGLLKASEFAVLNTKHENDSSSSNNEMQSPKKDSSRKENVSVHSEISSNSKNDSFSMDKL